MAEVAQAFDSDGDGLIDYAEFMQQVGSKPKGRPATASGGGRRRPAAAAADTRKVRETHRHMLHAKAAPVWGV